MIDESVYQELEALHATLHEIRKRVSEMKHTLRSTHSDLQSSHMECISLGKDLAMQGAMRMRRHAAMGLPDLMDGDVKGFGQAMTRNYLAISKQATGQMMMDSLIGPWLRSSSSPLGGLASMLPLAGAGMMRASGGPVTGGAPYIVGEQGPELFVPQQSGRIEPRHTASSQAVNITMHVQTPDLDGFKKSQKQLINEAMRHMHMAGRYR